MNLPSMDLFAASRARRVCSGKRIFGQSMDAPLKSAIPFMPPFLSVPFARGVLACFCWVMLVTLPAAVRGQTNYYSPNGTEYSVIGSLPGDQVYPSIAATSAGGFAVWQDKFTDGSGEGISARRLDGTLSGTLGTFRVNVQGTNNQENARVAMLPNGGAAFVWQGGQPGFQHIFGRFLSPSNTFLTNTDLAVSAFTNHFQINPVLATLANGNVVMVRASYDQAGATSMQDVYAKILSSSGQTVSNEFLVNQFTNFNQRTPAVAALNNGGFVIAWVSEQERSAAPNLVSNTTYYTSSTVPRPSVDIYARLYNAQGGAVGNEFLVNTDSNPCANPEVAAASDGSFMVAWSAKDMVNLAFGWDVFARSFTSSGTGGTAVRVNKYQLGDQYGPKISAIAQDYLIVWTSVGQDGSREGVFGQFVHAGGGLVGSEFRVNTTTVSQQIQPTVTSDGANQFLVVWASFTGAPNSFDLFGQRYLNVASMLQAMSAPFVSAPFTLSNGVYQPQLVVSWPVLLGISVSNYQVFVNGAASPMAVTTSNKWTMTTLNVLGTSSTNWFRVAYLTTAGQLSPLSPSASGQTWSGQNLGGIPNEWLARYFGPATNSWPSATADSDGDGANNLQEFLSGTAPTNSASVLVVQLTQSAQGIYLNWPTQPGLTYQVQVKTNLSSAWSNLGTARFAAGAGDSIFVGGSSAGYYRVVLLYQ